MAKLKLDTDIVPDVSVLAISSHVNDYRLCWALNNSMGIGMVRRRQGPGRQGQAPQERLIAFDHFDEPSQTHISLVGNHTPQGLLMPEHRNADFFLLLDHECTLDPKEALALVRQAEFVLMAYLVEITHLKDAYKLLQ